jgi:alpha-L-rhamnosidase
MRGTISSEWKNDNGQFTLKIEVPFNTTAIVYIPTKENKEITEGGIPISQVEGIENLGYKNDAYLIKVHSGNYVFTTHKNK